MTRDRRPGMARFSLVAAGILVLIAGCAPGPTLRVSSAVWTAAVADGAGTVRLSVAGSTNAPRVSVETYGDGLISEQDLALDASGGFSETIAISFTMAPGSGEFTASTKLRAYLGGAIETLTLTSPLLSYAQ